MLHVFLQNAEEAWHCVSLRSEGREGGDRKKLYNYVSFYDSHFHYVTINMFRYAFRFLETISHPPQLRVVKASIRYY